MLDKSEIALERLTKSRVSLMLDMPFFGVLALGMKIVCQEDIETAATDGKNLYYNSEFIESLTDEELNWVVVHELLHPVLGHLWRKGDRIHDAWNVACDYALHDVMTEYVELDYVARGKLHMPCHALYDPKYKNKSAEEIYDTFNIDQILNKLVGLLGSHELWDKFDDAEGKKLEDDWKQKVVESAMIAKTHGSMPGKLGRLVENITNPKKDWRVVLNEFTELEITDYSFSPPDKRFMDYEFFMPDFNEEDHTIKNILFLVDTSGSVGVAELEEFYSELVGAINQFKNKLSGKIAFFDSECYGLTDFDDVESLKAVIPQGGGGTSFKNAFKYVKDSTDENELAGIVVFTDGYAPFPEESDARGVPTLWAISKGSNIVPPWGTHISLGE